MIARSSKQSKFLSPWFLLILAIVAVLVLYACGRAYYQNYTVRQEIRRLQENARALESKKLETLEILKYVQSSAFVEEKARLELNMTKPGENVALVPTGELKTVGQEAVPVIQSSMLSNIKKWWQFFFH